MIERAKNSRLLKQILIGAIIGLLGGIMYGSLKWVVLMTMIGAILGGAGDIIDRTFYHPVEQGESPIAPMLTVALIIGMVTIVVIGAFVWLTA